MSSKLRACLILVSLSLVLGSLSAIACGSSKKSPTATPKPIVTTAPSATPMTTMPAPTVGPTPTMVQTTSVTIKDFEFTPASITVSVGATVTWTNDGPSTHTVTADDGSFNSGNLDKGKTFSHTFNTAGTFGYHCSIHPFMTATVVVQ